MKEPGSDRLTELRTLAECRMTEDDLIFLRRMSKQFQKRAEYLEIRELENVFSLEPEKEIKK